MENSGAAIVVRCGLMNAHHMKKILAFALLTLLATQLQAQSRAALEGDHKLQDRYMIMKDKAETFNDYKVIKMTILDGVWKITMDSLQKERDALKKANATIAQIKGQNRGKSEASRCVCG